MSTTDEWEAWDDGGGFEHQSREWFATAKEVETAGGDGINLTLFERLDKYGTDIRRRGSTFVHEDDDVRVALRSLAEQLQ